MSLSIMSQCQKVFILLLLGGALVCRQGEQPEQTKGETGGEDFRTVQKDGKPDTKEVSYSFIISRRAVGQTGRQPKLKTRPKQLLGFLSFDIALPGRTYFLGVQKNGKPDTKEVSFI